MKFLKLFFLVLLVSHSSSLAQETQKLDSLLKVLKTQEEDSLKADLLNEIIQIELYNNPVEVKGRIQELIQLSKRIGYSKGEAQGYYRKAGYFQNRSELDSAKYYYGKSMDINKSINNIRGILNCNVQIALVHMYQNNFDLTYEHLNRNIELYENRDSLIQNDDFKFIGSTYHTLTNVYTRQAMFNLALKSELKALRLYKLVGDEQYPATALNSLGDVENKLGNHQKALEYLLEANDIFVKHGNAAFELYTIINIGNAYYGLKDYQNALAYNKKGVELAKKNEQKGWEAVLWSNAGNAYENMNKIEKAIESQKKSIALYKELGNHIGTLYPNVNIGNLYRKTGDFEKSKYYLDLVLKEAEPNNLIREASLAYDFRSRLFKDMNRYDLALEDFKMFAKLKDSMFNKTKSQQIEELRTIHETEQKEQQIALQQKEITVLEQQAEISTLQKILLAGLLIISFFAFYGVRQKLKRNKLEKEKVYAELAFKKKELTTHALHLAKKNEVLEGLKQKAQELKTQDGSTNGYQQLIRTINFDLQDDNNWENFSRYFEEVHKDFNSTVKSKYPEVTSNELRLMALLKMNLSSKEIASILNISPEGIKKARYRLRKKLNIQTEDSLKDLVFSL